VPVVAGHDYNARLHQAVVRAVDEQFHGRVDLFGTVWIGDGRADQQKPALAA
jgi:hypothetical protein